MFQIDPLNRTPVYEQLIRQTERFVLTGIFKPQDQVPSVRALSVELGVNPNTIQKAYSQMEASGILQSVPGRGRFVTGEAKEIDLLQGCNKHEMGQFAFFLGQDFTAFFNARYDHKYKTMSDEDVEKAKAFMDRTLGNSFYKTYKFGDQIYFIAPVFRVSENHTASGGRTYHYYFRVETTMPFFLSGHAAELATVFNNPQETFFSGRAYDDTFNHTMQRMWVNFAKTGDPSLTMEESPAGKAIPWEPYNSDTRPIMVFDEFNVHQANEGDYGIVDWERTFPLTKYYIF